MNDLKEHRRKSFEDRYQQCQGQILCFLQQSRETITALQVGLDEFVKVLSTDEETPVNVSGYVAEMQEMFLELIEDIKSIIKSLQSLEPKVKFERDYILSIIQLSKVLESFLSQVLVEKCERCRDIISTIATIGSHNQTLNFVKETLKPRSSVLQSNLSDLINDGSTLLSKVDDQIHNWEKTFLYLQNDGNAMVSDPSNRRRSLRICTQIVYCDICTNCGNTDGFQGITCPSNHNFLCGSCFMESMKAQMEDYAAFRRHHGKLYNQFCHATQCPDTFPCYYKEDDIKFLLPASEWTQYLQQRINYEESLDGVYALIDLFRQVINRKTQHQQARLQHALHHISSHILTMLCPGCSVALPPSPSLFLPPGACMAVNCSLCNTYFCFWCLEASSTSLDCHIHVAQCEWNTYARGNTAAPPDDILAALQEQRKASLVKEYLRNHIRTEDMGHIRTALMQWIDLDAILVDKDL